MSMSEAKKKKRGLGNKKRQNLKKNPAKYEQYLKNERLRKNHSNLLKSSQSSSSSSSQNIQSSSQESSETLHRKINPHFQQSNPEVEV